MLSYQAIYKLRLWLCDRPWFRNVQILQPSSVTVFGCAIVLCSAMCFLVSQLFLVAQSSLVSQCAGSYHLNIQIKRNGIENTFTQIVNIYSFGLTIFSYQTIYKLRILVTQSSRIPQCAKRASCFRYRFCLNYCRWLHNRLWVSQCAGLHYLNIHMNINRIKITSTEMLKTHLWDGELVCRWYSNAFLSKHLQTASLTT